MEDKIYQLPEIESMHKLLSDRSLNTDNIDMLQSTLHENHQLKKNNLTQLIGIIEQREYLGELALYKIDKTICELHTKAMNLHSDYSQTDQKLKASLEQKACELETEKVRQQIKTFEDIAKFRKDLTQVITDYVASIRKTRLINPVNTTLYEVKLEDSILPEIPERIP